MGHGLAIRKEKKMCIRFLYAESQQHFILQSILQVGRMDGIFKYFLGHEATRYLG